MNLIREISTSHPSLWGQIGVVGRQSLLTWHDCVLTPPQRFRGSQHIWWRKYGFGAYNKNGFLIDSLCYRRGGRYIYRPRVEFHGDNLADTAYRNLDAVLYGGFISDHFGHLILDLNRAYQLCRAYRDSNLPIWFHYVPSPWPRSLKRPPLSELAGNWFDEMGLSSRIKIIRKPIKAKRLISSVSLFNDLAFASSDLKPACQAALKPQLQDQLLGIRSSKRVAYFSRHKLGAGTTRYLGEIELVRRLETHRHVDVFCPEDLSFRQKLSIYKTYKYVAAFPQSCLALKLFVPGDQVANQLLLIAGEKSLSSSWVNIARATNANDYYHTCTDISNQALSNTVTAAGVDEEQFARQNHFNIDSAFHAIKLLAE